MAYVRDNLVRSAGGLKGVVMQVAASGGKAVFNTGFKTINHVSWFGGSAGGGYDFVNSAARPPYNVTYFNTPVFNDGTLELSGSLVTDGTQFQIWAIGE